MITKTKQIGNVMADMSAWSNPSVGRVYDKKGLCPTINTCGGGGKQPHIIVEVKENDRSNCQIRKYPKGNTKNVRSE